MPPIERTPARPSKQPSGPQKKGSAPIRRQKSEILRHDSPIDLYRQDTGITKTTPPSSPSTSPRAGTTSHEKKIGTLRFEALQLGGQMLKVNDELGQATRHAAAASLTSGPRGAPLQDPVALQKVAEKSKKLETLRSQLREKNKQLAHLEAPTAPQPAAPAAAASPRRPARSAQQEKQIRALKEKLFALNEEIDAGGAGNEVFAERTATQVKLAAAKKAPAGHRTPPDAL